MAKSAGAAVNILRRAINSKHQIHVMGSDLIRSGEIIVLVNKSEKDDLITPTWGEKVIQKPSVFALGGSLVEFGYKFLVLGGKAAKQGPTEVAKDIGKEIAGQYNNEALKTLSASVETMKGSLERIELALGCKTASNEKEMQQINGKGGGGGGGGDESSGGNGE